MKSRHLLGLFLILSTALPQVFANTVTLGANNAQYRQGSGGEFNWIPNGGNPDNLGASYAAVALLGNGFESFCIQVQEHISFGGTYEYGISTAAKGPSGIDEVSLGTAWLYSQFATGSLANYDYTPGAGRAQSAGELQAAIWYLEGEIGNPGPNIFLSAALTQFNNEAGAKADALGAFGVYALNLGQAGVDGARNTWANQDQLIYRAVPDTGMTLSLLCFGLAGLFLYKRRA